MDAHRKSHITKINIPYYICCEAKGRICELFVLLTRDILQGDTLVELDTRE